MTQSSPRIAFVCGSLRTGSINMKLLKALKKRFKAAGARTSEVNLGDYDLPLYHGDIIPAPPGVKKLIRRLKSFDGVVIVTPEYNGGIPPLVKNAIDWTSTVELGHVTRPIYGLASCSPGPMSGIMCMRQLHYVLNRIGTTVVPTQVGTGNAEKAFDAKGNLIAEPSSTLADKMMEQMLTRIAEKNCAAE